MLTVVKRMNITEVSVLLCLPTVDSSLSSIEDSIEAKPTEVTKTNVLMQTATTTVKNIQGSSSRPVCLILDSGSQRTYVTERLAKEVKLNL